MIKKNVERVVGEGVGCICIGHSIKPRLFNILNVSFGGGAGWGGLLNFLGAPYIMQLSHLGELTECAHLASYL